MFIATYSFRLAAVIYTVAAVLLSFSVALPAVAQPPYAKWGRIAMEQTKKAYPQAGIVDYLHVGRKQKTPTTSEETFKLVLQEGSRRWALLVHIEFNKRTEQIVRIRFEQMV